MIHSINCNGKLMEFDEPKIMGILNLTPDSFYENSRINGIKEALVQVEKMLTEGADIIDIGAMSTRPGIEEISLDEEKKRLIPIFCEIRKEFPDAVLSVDTYRAEIAEIAIENGADIINDISGGTFDENMYKIIAEHQIPFIMMHTPAKPKVMQNHTQYDNILNEIALFFGKNIFTLLKLGAKDIIIDPGFGFGKTPDQGFHILKNLRFFSELGVPILAGLSRKSMIYKTLNGTPENSLTGTIALNLIALQNGASILRVHDVKEAIETKTLFLKLEKTL